MYLPSSDQIGCLVPCQADDSSFYHCFMYSSLPYHKECPVETCKKNYWHYIIVPIIHFHPNKLPIGDPQKPCRNDVLNIKKSPSQMQRKLLCSFSSSFGNNGLQHRHMQLHYRLDGYLAKKIYQKTR